MAQCPKQQQEPLAVARPKHAGGVPIAKFRVAGNSRSDEAGKEERKS
jgi:hypothetical protein